MRGNYKQLNYKIMAQKMTMSEFKNYAEQLGLNITPTTMIADIISFVSSYGYTVRWSYESQLFFLFDNN